MIRRAVADAREGSGNDVFAAQRRIRWRSSRLSPLIVTA
jgi:hypothetical protein